MYVLIVPIHIQPEHREAFLESMLDDAIGSVRDEPGCLRFDVIQDSSDPNCIYLYEVYRDEAAFQAHVEAPHFVRWRETVKDWFAKPPEVARGTSIFPPDDAWAPQAPPAGS